MLAIDLMDVIRRTIADLRELELFVSVSQRALSNAGSAIAQLDLVEEIERVLGEDTLSKTPEDRENARVHAKKIQSFALDQRTNGFPYLYSLSTIRLWGIIEACVNDLVAGAVSTPDSCKNIDLLFRLKGPLLEFTRASSEDQAEFLAELLKNTVEAPLKPGAGRFEAVLDPCGLGGRIDDLVRKVLLELSQVRNLVVHKSSRVDKRVLEQCPWLRRRTGDALHTSAADFAIYFPAAYWYILELSVRVRRRAGSGESERLPGLLADLLTSVQAAWTSRERIVDAE